MLNYKHLRYFHEVAKLGSIARAAERLHLSPQTLSGQLTLFEYRAGVKLFRRSGRRLELTDSGKLALKYADEIFQIGSELEQALQQDAKEHAAPFRVGIADVVPKSIAHRLLQPVLGLSQAVRLVCSEDRLDRLLADLSIHKLDMVLADRPIPPGIDIKGFSHPLGECAVSFMATPSLSATLSGEFPLCLNGAPLLLPGVDSALRAPLLRWLERNDLKPVIVGEFDDSALMKVFGQSGAGVFPALETSVADAGAQSGTLSIGRTNDIRERFFAITVERKISHPAVKAVIDAAITGLFD